MTQVIDGKPTLSKVLYDLDDKTFLHTNKHRGKIIEKYGLDLNNNLPSLPFNLLLCGGYNPLNSDFEHIDGQPIKFLENSWMIFIPIADLDILDQYPAIIMSNDGKVLFCPCEDLHEVLRTIFAQINPEASQFFYGRKRESGILKGSDKLIKYYTFLMAYGEATAMEDKFAYQEICIGEIKNFPCTGEDVLIATGFIRRWWEDMSGNRIWNAESISSMHERLGIMKLGKYFIKLKRELVVEVWEDDPVSQGNLFEGYHVIAPGVYLQQVDDICWIGGYFKPKSIRDEQVEPICVNFEFKGPLLVSTDEILRAIARHGKHKFWRSYIDSHRKNRDKEDTVKQQVTTPNAEPVSSLYDESMMEHPHLRIYLSDIRATAKTLQIEEEFDILLKRYPIVDGMMLEEIIREAYWSRLKNESLFKQTICNVILEQDSEQKEPA